MDNTPWPAPQDGQWPVPWSAEPPPEEPVDLLTAAFTYSVDAAQRWVLFLDTLRERGNAALLRAAEVAPHVLNFDHELLIDGRTLPRPVNYGLVRVVPPPGVATDPNKRPFIIFDPRAGHGPGIGGMKAESEIGQALAAGHPCYFAGFAQRPMPGQTVEDVCRAELRFVREVAARHDPANGKPVLIGNCQAGWQIMIMAALEPDLAGPMLLAGTPLSYWQGVRGHAPLRYLGGLFGGTWMTALGGDLGAGIFDGASLVANFEAMHPEHALWRKPYDLYSKVDTEAERFLAFERWWGSPVLLNAEEMQWIADNLFVGNRLTAGRIVASDGVRIDLRNIRSPIVVFCSKGDDITPPQQALGWVLDLYDRTEAIAEAGQTIVYTMHHSIGHLGIFVSGRVAEREHGEFAQCMDMIDICPPGLFEAVIEGVPEHAVHPDLIQGRYLFRLEPRTLDDIRALGGNSEEDDQRFATVARVSAANLGLYRMLAAPLIRSWVTPEIAAVARSVHPLRARFAAFSDRNPLMAAAQQAADAVRAIRRPAGGDNPFSALEHLASDWIESTLASWGGWRDMWTEAAFHTVYGNPLVQAAAGMLDGDLTHRGPTIELAREAATARLQAEVMGRVTQGGLPEALARALLWVLKAAGQCDERAFWALNRLPRRPAEEGGVTLPRFREIVHEQAMMLTADEARAIATLPALVPPDAATWKQFVEAVRSVAEASGPPGAEATARIERLAAMAPAA